jgi:hypothetical protein
MQFLVRLRVGQAALNYCRNGLLARPICLVAFGSWGVPPLLWHRTLTSGPLFQGGLK